MRRFLTGPAAILTVVVLIAGCTSSDDTADEATTTAPAATVAAPETATTTASTTSTTMSPAAAIAAVNAFNDALNAYDADAMRAVCAEGAIDRYNGIMIGSPEWEQLMITHRELRGVENTMADCEVTDHMVTCQVTVDEKNLTGKAGIVLTLETYIHVNDQGLITAIDWTFLSGVEEYDAFEAALGAWMATAHPEAYETFIPGFGSNEEAWLSGIDELSPLIDEFVAQSDEYPLRETATADSSSDDFNELYVGTWKTKGGKYQQYSEDGTYRVGRSAEGVESNPIEVGTYEFDGETLRLRAFDDSEYCAGIEAVYEAEFSESGTVVTHTLVTDDCGVRANDKDQRPIRKLP